MTTPEQRDQIAAYIENAAFPLGKRQAMEDLANSEHSAVEFAWMYAEGGNPTMAACFLAPEFLNYPSLDSI